MRNRRELIEEVVIIGTGLRLLWDGYGTTYAAGEPCKPCKYVCTTLIRAAHARVLEFPSAGDAAHRVQWEVQVSLEGHHRFEEYLTTIRQCPDTALGMQQYRKRYMEKLLRSRVEVLDPVATAVYADLDVLLEARKLLWDGVDTGRSGELYLCHALTLAGGIHHAVGGRTAAARLCTAVLTHISPSPTYGRFLERKNRTPSNPVIQKERGIWLDTTISARLSQVQNIQYRLKGEL